MNFMKFKIRRQSMVGRENRGTVVRFARPSRAPVLGLARPCAGPRAPLARPCGSCGEVVVVADDDRSAGPSRGEIDSDDASCVHSAEVSIHGASAQLEEGREACGSQSRPPVRDRAHDPGNRIGESHEFDQRSQAMLGQVMPGGVRLEVGQTRRNPGLVWPGGW
ncbi:MAG TPA: hypothetical protein VFF24_16530 [Acidimicrobiia bacterium]|nr:hypothetical protein [Acidimicrobiia bacterium]